MFPLNSTQPVDFSLYKNTTPTAAPAPTATTTPTVTPTAPAPTTYTTPSGAVVSASGSLLSGPTTSAPQPVTLNADAINNPATLYQVPNAPAAPNYSATLASIPTIESIMAEKSPDQIAAESTQKSLQDRILGVLGSLGGKGTAEATAEQNAGIPDLQKQLGDVNAQIRSLQAEAQAIPLKDQEDATGRGITAAGLAPIEASKLRLNTIQALGLSAIAATLQGNLGLAQAQVAKQISTQFDPLQAQLDYLKQAYDFNSANMSTADKEQAAIIQGKLQERQTAIDAERSDVQTTMGYVLTAARNGAPANILSAAQQMSPVNATIALKQWLPAGTGTNSDFTLSAGQTRFDSNGNPIASVAPKSTAPASLFTPTQFNSGAASAGLPIADFKSLDQNTQNYFINTYKSSQLSKDVSAVIAGSLTKSGQNKQQVASNVQSSNLPDAVKQIILKMLGVSSAAAATAPQSGGFLNTAWSGVKSALGGIASWLGI